MTTVRTKNRREKNEKITVMNNKEIKKQVIKSYNSIQLVNLENEQRIRLITMITEGGLLDQNRMKKEFELDHVGRMQNVTWTNGLKNTRRNG